MAPPLTILSNLLSLLPGLNPKRAQRQHLMAAWKQVRQAFEATDLDQPDGAQRLLSQVAQFTGTVQAAGDGVLAEAQAEQLQALLERLAALLRETLPENRVAGSATMGRQEEEGALLDQVDGLLKAAQSSAGAKRWLRLLLYVLPIGLSYWLGSYLQSNNGLVVDHVLVTHPSGAYELPDDDLNLALRADYQERFWDAFPDYYFSEAEDPEALFYFDGDRHLLEVKLVLANQSASFPLMVSTLEVEVSRDSTPAFPWQQLAVDATLAWEQNDTYLHLQSTGTGPALDVALQMTIGEHAYYADTQAVLMPGNGWMAELLHDLPAYVQFDVSDSGIIDPPLYAPLEAQEPGSVRFGSRFFKPVETVEALAAITDVFYQDTIRTTFTYRNLRNDTITGTAAPVLPGQVLLAREDSLLLNYEEALALGGAQLFAERLGLESGVWETHASRKPAGKAFRMADKAYAALGNEAAPHPEGKAMIKASVTLPLEGLAQGRTVRELLHTDEVLNPQGFVVLYLTLDQPAHGAYTVQINLNGQEVTRTRIETLVPEEARFDYPNSLERFGIPR